MKTSSSIFALAALALLASSCKKEWSFSKSGSIGGGPDTTANPRPMPDPMPPPPPPPDTTHTQVAPPPQDPNSTQSSSSFSGSQAGPEFNGVWYDKAAGCHGGAVVSIQNGQVFRIVGSQMASLHVQGETIDLLPNVSAKFQLRGNELTLFEPNRVTIYERLDCPEGGPNSAPPSDL